MRKNFFSLCAASLAFLLPGLNAHAALVNAANPTAVFQFDLSSFGDLDFITVQWCAVGPAFSCNNTAATTTEETVEPGGGFDVAFSTVAGGSELGSFVWNGFSDGPSDNAILSIDTPERLGAPLSAPAALSDLFVTLTFTGDEFAARQLWLRYVDGAGSTRLTGELITVAPEVPLPAAAPLLLTGLAGLFGLRTARRRKEGEALSA
jgi:hypothetical protein